MTDPGPSPSAFERRFEMLTRVVPVGIIVTDAEGNCTYANPRWCELAGLEAHEVLGRGWSDAIHPDDREATAAEWERAQASELPFECECRFMHPDGRTVWVVGQVVPERGPTGELQGFIGTVTDISETRRVRQQLQEREAGMRSVLETAVDGIVIIDERGRIEAFNPAAERMFGYREEELLGRNVSILMPSPDRERHDGYLRNYLGTGEAKIIGIGREVVGRRKDGSEFSIDLGVSELEGEARRFTGILRDITEQKRAHEALQESRRTLATLVGNLPGIAYRCHSEPDRRMIFVSAGCRELTGYDPEDFVDNRVLAFVEILHPEDRDTVWQEVQEALGHRGRYRISYRIRTAQGEERWVTEQGCGVFDDEGRVLALEGIITDISEQKKLELEFLQAQKMEAVGRLAGGIAHDFNNLLTGIISGCRIAEDAAGRDLDEALGVLGQIRREAKRGANMTRQLLDFSRKRSYERKAVHLNDVVAGAEQMLRKLLSEDIDLVVELDPRESQVLGDAGQLEQVLVNLAVNARDAMPEGGRLLIRVQRREPGPGPRVDGGAGSVVLEVTDTGCGMDEATMERAFEPFFTTKEVGKGTGLGLSTVFGTVREFGGRVELDSQPGVGTRFRLHFPPCAAHEEPAAEQRPAERGAGNGETILVVEDEALVRAGIQHILSELGYHVLVAGTPAEALRICDGRSEPIDLLLTDMVMPQMSGNVLAREVAERVPGIKVMFMSAYSDEALIEQGRLESGTQVLEKPFEEEELARRIRACLGGAG